MVGTRCDPEGFEPYHVHVFLLWLYGNSVPSATPRNDIVAKTARNAEIYRRYQAGESPSALAREYGISEQRIYVIVRKQRNH